MQQLQAGNETLRAMFASYCAPLPPAGQFLHIYSHPELGALDCHLEWQDAESEAGWSEQVTLCSAYLRGIDISNRLHPREVSAIELEATQGAKQAKRDHIPLEAELIGAELDAESLEQGEPA